jgi:dephospho-CoA kinase
MSKLQQYLTEKQIIVGKGASYGQIVFLAGGAGSGKGFAASNFLEKSKFKVRDVDELKKSAVKLAQAKKTDPEIANTNFGNADDVFKLHAYVKEKGWKDETFRLIMQGASQGKLPNILFDVTMKDIGDIKEVMPTLLEVGYDPVNIHVVWVLTDFYVAVQQNQERERRVPYDILLKTHVGAANTVTDMLRKKFGVIGNHVNGEMYVILGGHKNTVLMTDLDTKETIKGKSKFEQLPGKPIVRQGKFSGEAEFVIKSFKYVKLKDAGKPMKRSIEFEKEMLGWDELRDFIKKNIPKTTDTRNIRRRKRV